MNALQIPLQQESLEPWIVLGNIEDVRQCFTKHFHRELPVLVAPLVLAAETELLLQTS